MTNMRFSGGVMCWTDSGPANSDFLESCHHREWILSSNAHEEFKIISLSNTWNYFFKIVQKFHVNVSCATLSDESLHYTVSDNVIFNNISL